MPLSDIREELRQEFRESALPRIGRMSALLDTLTVNPADHEALGELARHFHGFVGMGATCGYAHVSVLAESGEVAARLAIRKGKVVRAAEVDQWRGILSQIDGELRDDSDVAT